MANELQTRGSWWQNNFRFRDEDCGPAAKTSLMELVPYSVQLDPAVGFFWKDDFYTMISTKAAQSGFWAVTEDDGSGGTNAVQEETGGWYKHWTDGDDEDEAYVHGNKEVFKVQANKHLWFEAQIRCTEAATNAANLIVGLSEAVGADHLLDAGAGPPASYDGICWYKVDGTMSWVFETSLAAAQVNSGALLTHVTAEVFRLGFWVKPLSSTTVAVYPTYMNVTSGTGITIGSPQTLTVTGHGELEPFFGVKAGSAAEQSIDIDYLWVAGTR